MAATSSSSSSSSSSRLLLFLLLIPLSTTATSSPEDLLLAFKSSLTDPTSALSNWSPSTPLCNWTGITCTHTPTHLPLSLSLPNLRLSGPISPSLCLLPSLLSRLDLSLNPLSSPLPLHLSLCLSLTHLNLSRSLLWGPLPHPLLLSLPHLLLLDLSRNNLTGRLPPSLTLPNLRSLDLSHNLLAGQFPASRFPALETLQIHDNALAGEFPSAIWSLPNLRLLRAENNRFSGSVPESVSYTLEQVRIDNNEFSGKIPRGLGRIKTMYAFSASRNGFSGNLPDDFCGSAAMSILNLSHNSLSGAIPPLGNCSGLVSLSLADNGFTGSIPESLADLPVLTYIDLSSNELTGEIPWGIQNLKLALFNVSFNRLSGPVPLPLTAGLPASFLEGNPGLCGPGLSNACGERVRRSDRLSIAVIMVAFGVGLVVLVLGLFLLCRLYRRDSRSSDWKSVFFYPLRIGEDDLLMSLDEKRAIGTGPLGNVHLFRLPGGEFVAVKRLLNRKHLSLRKVKSEIETLAKARHRNLAKILGFCYSESAVLVIHEYHRNGSLGDVLRSDMVLDWGVRLKIALGTARGLAYLHRDYVPRLLHRNLKSCNVLLDDDFEPKVVGFGLHSVVGDASYPSSMASGLDPCCYVAPEHGYSKKATEQMDTYSYGVVLLELITGRQAENQDSRDAPDVVKWVRRKVNTTNGSFQVLDPKISSSSPSSSSQQMRALDLALRCTSFMPDKRPAIDEIVRSLESLRSIVDPPNVYSGELPLSSELRMH